MVNGYLNQLWAQSPGFFWGFEIVSWVALPLLVFYFLFQRYDLKPSEIGCANPFPNKSTGSKFIFTCLVLAILDYLIYRDAYQLFYELTLSEPIFEYQSLIPETGTSRFVVIWYFAITAGIVEEIYFRGLLFKVSNLFGSPIFLYLLISPILFSLIHWEGGLSNIGATYVLGLFCCLVFLWLKNIWPLVVAHISTDLIWFH